MSCDFGNSLLHAYFDGELNSIRAIEFERHASHCSECVTELADLDLLSARLQIARLYAPAPTSLRRKVQSNLKPVTFTPVASKPALWHWLAAVAALVLFAVVGWRVNVRNDDYKGEFAEEIVEAHIASLRPGSVIGIASNDAHVVKGWLEGKARFAVPVRDLSRVGFELQGARVDLVEGHTIPALVYTHDGHLVNVFIWPTRERDTAPREGARQGFQWVDWRKRKMEFCAVSDVDPADLKELYELMDSSTG